MITSPPYNIIRANSTDRGYDVYKDGMSNEEYIEWTIHIFEQYNRLLSENGCVLYNMSYGAENTTCMSLTIAEIITKTNFTLADIIVWEKHSATPNNVSKNRLTRICEFIYIFCRKDELGTFNAYKKELDNNRATGQKIYGNVFNKIKAKNNDESTEMNKATFSTELVKKLMHIYTKKGDVVMDNFMGTGTTAVACFDMDRQFIGFELSQQQCEYANKRVHENSLQFRMEL